MAFKNSYYKLLLLILLFISPKIFAQNPNPKGITIISHGFNLFGDFLWDKYWYDFAAAVKQRAGNGATIYTNDLQTGQWVRLAESKYNVSRYGNNGIGSPNEEIIFFLNWTPLSNISWEIQSDGQLEAAADHLFAMLTNPPQILNFSDGGIWNNSKPVHFIGHSRGSILNLQICHRILKYFPTRLIDHYTSLDSHPAIGSIIPMQINDLFFNRKGILNDLSINSSISLPGVYGSSLYGGNSILVPNNIVKADNYFRQDGTYELDGAFDGISNLSAGNFNRELNNDSLLDNAHTRVHEWFLGTIDTLVNENDAPTFATWYKITNGFNSVSKNPKFSESRSKTGYYYSRLGGGYNLLPTITNSTNLSEMDNRIASRSGGKLTGLQPIFNGHFQYGISSWFEAYGNDLHSDAIISNNSENFLKLNIVNLKATHELFYFQSNSDYITFKAKANVNFSSLRIKFFDGSTNEVFSTSLLILKSDDYINHFVKVPNSLKGKTGTFSLELITDSGDITSEISIDDIDLTNNAPAPIASITALGETTFCNASQTVQLKASTTNPDYEYQWQKNGSNISATDTIYSANSAGDYTLKVTSKSTLLTATSEPTTIDFKTLTDFTVSGGGTVGIGEAIALNATGGEYYLWQGPDGFISNVQYPVRYSATTNMSGDYTVKITAKSGCSATANVSVNVVSVSENSTNCPPLVRSLKSIDNNLGSAYHTQPFSDDKYITVLYKDNIYSLALLDSNLAVVWRKTLSSNVTELVTDNMSIFVRIGNTISKYNSSGNLIWSTVPSIKIVQTLRTTISYPYSSSSTIGDIIINPNIVSMAQSNDGGVSFLFGSNTYKNKTEQSQYYSSQYQRTITVTNEYSYSPVNNSATETEDFFVAKIGSNGTVSWFKSYGDNCNSENPIKIKSTSNGGFVFMGKSCNNLLKTYKIDANGNTNWNSQLTLLNNSDVPVTLAEAPDGGALVGVNIFRNNQYDMWFGKISSGGGLSWSKTFGGQTGHSTTPTLITDAVSDIIYDGSNFYLSGIHQSVDGNVINNNTWYYYPWIANISNSGNINWSKKYTLYEGSKLNLLNGKIFGLSGSSVFQLYDFKTANFQLNHIEKLCYGFQYLNLELSKDSWSNADTHIKSIWYKDGKKIDDVSTNTRSFYQDGTGTYHAKIEMTNGCTVVTPPVTIVTPKVSSNAIYVYNTDVSGYQSTSNGLCEGATLNLTTEGGDSYAWTGPNGFVSNQQNPSIPNITTANGGTYYVTIMNNKRNCNVTLSTEVKVIDEILNTFTIRSPIEEGEHTSFYYCCEYNNVLGTKITGPNGYIKNNANTVGFDWYNVSLAQAGTYTVQKQIGHCIKTYTQNLEVNPCPLNPVIRYEFQNSSSVGFENNLLNSSGTNLFCIKTDTKVTLTAQGNSGNNISGYNYQWYRFGVPIANATNSHIYINQSGTYSVKVSRSGRCEKVSPNYVININYEPEFTTNIPTPKPICQGQPFTFQASPQTNSYQWFGPDNFNATGHTIAVTNIQPSRSGLYTVRATNSAGCSLTKQTYFQVEENPKPYGGWIEGNGLQPCCQGIYTEGVPWALMSSFYNYNKYFWEGPNNFTATSSYPDNREAYYYYFKNASILQSGQYKLTIESNNGCKSSVNTSIEIKKIELLADKQIVCKGGQITLSVRNCNNTVLWSTSDSTQNGNGKYVYPQHTTTYNARCKVGNFIGTVSEPITINVYQDPPKPVIRADNYSICYPDIVTLRSSGCSYQTSWYPYNTTVTDSVLNVNLPIGTHKLAFKCISANGCTTGLKSDSITVNVYSKPYAPMVSGTIANEDLLPKGTIINLNASLVFSDSSTINWYFKRPNGTYIGTIFNKNSITYTLNETTIVYASTKTRHCETKSNGSQYFVDSNINVGCYSMDGNAQDGSGRGRHGDIRGSVIATTDRFNNPNSAIYFPGNLDSWMRVGTPLPVGPSFTINAWMYRENGSSFYLLGQGKKDMLSGWFGLLCGDEFYEKPGFGVKYGAFTPDKSYAYSNESLENNKWYMLTGVLDNINDKIKFYVNGILKGESLYEHDNPLITFYGFPFAIGRHTASQYDFLNYGTGETYPFKGKIDDVCIFNEALTDAQILAMYGIIDCPENAQINGQNFYMLPNKLIKKASNTINSNSTIFSSSVEFNAGKAIILGHGFKVERGAVFKTSIEGCGNTNTPIPQPASQFLYDKEAIDPKKKN